MKSSISSLISLQIFLYLVFLVGCNEIKQRTFPFEGTIAAFGDFNSDKFTDIFLIKDNHKCLQIIFQIPDITDKDRNDVSDFRNCENVLILYLSDLFFSIWLGLSRKSNSFEFLSSSSYRQYNT